MIKIIDMCYTAKNYKRVLNIVYEKKKYINIFDNIIIFNAYIDSIII